MEKSKKALVGLVVVAAVVLIGTWVLAPNDTANQTAAVNQAQNTLPAAVGAADIPSLLVEDQVPGTIVYVSDIQFKTEGGWVVIRAAEGNTPGEIIGAGYYDQYVNAGEINLAQPTLDGRAYYAMLYHDNGDISFSDTTDTPWLGLDGQPLLVRFNVTSDLMGPKG